MFLDQSSLLVAVGLSGAALAVAFLTAWLVQRDGRHLLVWCSGLLAIISGIVFFNIGSGYNPALQCMAMLSFIAGFALIEIGGAMFCTGKARLLASLAVTMAAAVLVAAAFAAGRSGTGTIIANAAICALLLMTGARYWLQRAEAPVAMIPIAGLYAATGLSFLLCAVVLAADGQFVLAARPSNWAEEVNAMTAVIGMTGIGAITFAVMQYRTSQLHRLDALTDPLTRLANRRALMRLFPEQKVGMGACIILFDIDHFKLINDRFGHAAGDAVLIHFSDLLNSEVEGASIVARLGGEEFGVILEDASSAGAHLVAERVRKQFAERPIIFEGESVAATVSAGFAICPGASETLTSLLSRADRALYDAKKGGRNRVSGPRPALVRQLVETREVS